MKVLRARPSCLQNSRGESPLSSCLFSVSSHSALERRLIFFFDPGTVSASTICSPAWREPIRSREREAGEERSSLTAYFAGSQWEPGDLNMAVASESLFWLDVDYLGRRRGGAMTARHKQIDVERARRLGKPPRGIATRTCRKALLRLAGLPPKGRPLEFFTDEDKPTANAVNGLKGTIPICHRTISSKVWRELPNHLLWRVNHEHRLVRHGKKNHTRETIAFSKTAAGLMDRALVYMGWRNNVKGVSERRSALSRVTPAMRLGPEKRPLRLEEIFHLRRFPLRDGMPRGSWPHYLGILRSRPGESATTYRYETSCAR